MTTSNSTLVYIKQALQLAGYSIQDVQPIANALSDFFGKKIKSNQPLKSIFAALNPQVKNENQFFGSNSKDLLLVKKYPVNHSEAVNNFLIEAGKALNDHQLFQLVQEHFSRIPVADNGYDAATTLANWIQIYTGVALSFHGNDKGNIGFISADLSGIQSYLYQISSKNAAKSLRGRSFFLQLFIDELLIQIESELINSPFQRLYVTGGKFYIFTGNKNFKHVLVKTNEVIEKYLFEKFNGTLFACLVGTSFSLKTENKILLEEQNHPQSISSLWVKISELNSVQKASKFKSILLAKNGFQQLFSEKGNNSANENGICGVTGQPIFSKSDVRKLNVDGSDSEKSTVLLSVKQQIDLGKELPRLSKITLVKDASSLPKDNQDKIMDGFSGIWYFGEDKVQNPLYTIYFNDAPKSIQENYHVKNSTSKSVATIEGRGNAIIPKSNEELAESNNYIEKLGVLRMDVDNLGKLFQGMETEERSFSFLLTLSQAMDQFFTHGINQIRNQSEFKNNISIIYAGGDDLFAVGQWHSIIKFEENIRKEFTNYTVEHPHLGISSGIAVVNSSFPISKSADISGEAESQSKKYKHQNIDKEKDAVTLLGITVGHGEEWKQVSNGIGWFEEKLKVGLSRTALQSMGMSIRNFISQERYGVSNINQSWRWVYPYRFAKTLDRRKPEQKDALDNLSQYLISQSSEQFKKMPLEQFLLCTRMAELKTKK